MRLVPFALGLMYARYYICMLEYQKLKREGKINEREGYNQFDSYYFVRPLYWKNYKTKIIVVVCLLVALCSFVYYGLASAPVN